MRKFNTYVAYTNDKYGLPVCVAESIDELAAFLESSASYVRFCLAYDTLCRGFEVKCYALVV